MTDGANALPVSYIDVFTAEPVESTQHFAPHAQAACGARLRTSALFASAQTR